ncbi:MAG TPA: hypothetical protein VFG15_06930 [Amycolatopsis sp.]|nr:hypothetical protein [Amycolatopsis sp.]
MTVHACITNHATESQAPLHRPANDAETRHRVATTTKRLEIALVAAEALGRIAWDPIICLSKDERRVLLRGPQLPSTWPERTPAQEAAHADALPVVSLTAKQCIDIATGAVVDIRTDQDEPARIRLATAVELMVANRRARRGRPADQLPAPMDAAAAADLVAPVAITDAERRFLMQKYRPWSL